MNPEFRAERQRLSGAGEKLFPDLEMVHTWSESFATSRAARTQQGSEPGAQLGFDLGEGGREGHGLCREHRLLLCTLALGFFLKVSFWGH